MLNHCLEWDKWVLTNFDHDMQGCNTLFHLRTSPQRCILFVSPSGTAISRLSGPVMSSSVRYTTPDIYCRDRRYECNGGIRTGRQWRRQQIIDNSCSTLQFAAIDQTRMTGLLPMTTGVTLSYFSQFYRTSFLPTCVLDDTKSSVLYVCWRS